MTNNPNLKLEILRFVRDEDDANLREFCGLRDYSETRVASKVGELYPLLEYGVSPMHPWIKVGKEDAVDERIAEYESHE